MLFAYWDALRGERAAPERGDVKPGGLRHILADTFVLSLDGSGTARFRLAGTRIGALFGRDLREVPFARLWPEPDDVDALVAIVVEDTAGLVAGLLGTNETGSELPLELILLPLRHRGRPDLRILGALSPASIPSWAGLVPLARLSTRSLRIIEPSSGGVAAGESTDPAAALPVSAARARRDLFVVHEGGRYQPPSAVGLIPR